MTAEETTFRQTAVAKHLAGNHMTFYEKVSVGRHYAPQLNVSDMDMIKGIADETYEDERQKIEDLRRVGLDSFRNDLRMDVPIMLTIDMHLFHGVYKFVASKNDRN